MRRIGFVQEEDNEATLTDIGYAETGASDSEDGDGFDWALKGFFDFCIVYGMIAVVKDLIDYFWRP